MEKTNFRTEDELIQMYQNKEISLIEFIEMHSEEWCDEYIDFCAEKGIEMDESSALDFIEFKGNELEEAIERHEA